jgi:TDG/mug DNA glycosylase family protein
VRAAALVPDPRGRAHRATHTRYGFKTLSDLLRQDLDLVFVGINPGLYSLKRGRYFARTTNRFWPAFSRSRLSAAARRTAGRRTLGPDDDAALLGVGIGFTDVVKRPSRNAAELTHQDFRFWAPRLLARLRRYRPRVACFHGVTGYRVFLRYALQHEEEPLALGPQPLRVGRTRIFLAPNPSPANAHFTLADQVHWYDRLAAFLTRA